MAKTTFTSSSKQQPMCRPEEDPVQKGKKEKKVEETKKNKRCLYEGRGQRRISVWRMGGRGRMGTRVRWWGILRGDLIIIG